MSTCRTGAPPPFLVPAQALPSSLMKRCHNPLLLMVQQDCRHMSPSLNDCTLTQTCICSVSLEHAISLLWTQQVGCNGMQRESLSSRQASDSGKVQALQPRGLSLEQAGGLQRMTLRGHSAGLQKVMLSPTGIDVITGWYTSAWQDMQRSVMCWCGLMLLPVCSQDMTSPHLTGSLHGPGALPHGSAACMPPISCPGGA